MTGARTTVDTLCGPTRIREGTITCGCDADGNWVSIERTRGAAETVRLPRWMGGVGGMELVVSIDQRYLALFIYSGQSSLGYELFVLEPSLQRIGGLPEVEGKGTAPVFSPDGRWLVALVAVPALVRGTGAWFEDVQDDAADDRVIVDWAALFAQRLPGAEITRVAVGVEIARSTDVDAFADWHLYDALRFIDERTVVLSMSWGEDLTVSLPSPGPVTGRIA